MVSAILTGVFDLAPTKLYKVGTMQEIPKPTSMKPKELMITFIAIDSKTPPNRAETKKPIQINRKGIARTFQNIRLFNKADKHS